MAKGLPQPENYETHTTVRDKNEKFAFNFPDVDGKLISNEDPRFKSKVVLAIVTGTWCPNCHDEAQYLVQLDKKYRDKGLAIVALDFEEPEQQGSLDREKAFVKQYGGVHLPDCWRPGRDVGEGSSGGESQYLAGDDLHWS